MRSHLLRSFLAAFLVVVVASQAAAQPTTPRLVVVLRDETGSFKRYFADAQAAIARIVDGLGPGDTFIIIDVGGPFDPQTQVHETTLPSVPALIFEPSKTFRDYQLKQAILDNRWAAAKRLKATITEEVARPLSAKKGTDVFAVLDYASHRMQEFEGEKRIVLVSDLETDIAGMRTALPPRQRYAFTSVVADALFVPWHGSRQTGVKMNAWREWFTSGGARSFQMYDEARSRTISILAASTVPTRVVSPFAKLTSN